jgi:hypothetical protein
MRRGEWLLILGLFSLCGCAATSGYWWTGLTTEAQALFIGRGLMLWTCCGAPMGWAVAIYLVLRQRTWRGLRKEEL